ncbi:MAG: phenylalanine--tRNA ligase subunit beta [Chloroflexi bacterium]|nr:phenylalanine--tRNA ligase subunit beta [Chloroflexota bacterium]
MKAPLSWLKDFVDITMSVEELAERLTLAGLEVDHIEHIGADWDREKIVVGQIIRVDPHPNADRLTLATVDYGADEPLTVVTGAPNVKQYEGKPLPGPLKVAFAMVGAELIDGYADDGRKMKLKPAKIRGIRSEGMVCSEKELGLSDEHTGILYLPADAPVGMPLADYMGDVVLDFDIKGGFAYLYSIVGIAREIAALTDQKARLDVLTILDRQPVEIRPDAPWLDLEIADPDLCARYSAAMIRGVQIGPSPDWMQQRLRRAGMRPINNIVDITNYVMLELGQPLHAFDYAKLRPRPGEDRPAIIVRRARPGERMTTLDGVERELDPEMLLITDGGGPVAIAGVMGGLESEVTEATTDILLESANFDYINNRRTAKALNLPSEAATRFGKRVDPELTVKALARACQLLEELAGGKVEPLYADLYPGRKEPTVIDLRLRDVPRILGADVSRAEVERILHSLEFDTASAGEGILRVTVPSYRLDVTQPVDLIEEIGRIWGYDRLPSTLIQDELPPQRDNPQFQLEERVRDLLVGAGLQEVITYTLISPSLEGKLYPGQPVDESRYIGLANPMSSERTHLRRTLAANLLTTIRSHLRYVDRVALFEIGRVYLKQEGQDLPDEEPRLGIAMTGPRGLDGWLDKDSEPLDFFDLKGVVEILLDRLDIGPIEYRPIEHPTYQPGRSAEIVLVEEGSGEAVRLGTLGEVHPVVREAFDLPAQRVGLAELSLRPLIARYGHIRTLQPISPFPAVKEDLAIVVDQDIPATRVEEVIRKAGGRLLQAVRLFDVYQGASIPEGKKSLAYALTYQALDRTLTDEEVASIRARIIRRLERELGAQLRA